VKELLTVTISPTTSLLARALAADPAIAALDLAIAGLCVSAREADGPFCAGCAWTRIIKPLALPLVGWERGRSAIEARDPGSSWAEIDLTPYLDRPPLRDRLLTQDQLAELEPPRSTATTETERWLRSQEAWDVVTRAWMARLQEADPGLGHGLTGLEAGTGVVS
jgi:hypothetical protein